jgi:3-dehydroquinate synthase
MSGLMARDPSALAYAIERSCANKAEVVADDEFETAKEGGRALLNLGHTFGHAIETGMGYGAWLHGEAVAAGTMIAATLSRQLGWISPGDLARVKSLFVAAGLPTVSPLLGGNRYLELMSHDKKVLAGKLRLILLRQLGQAETVTGVSIDEIRQAIHDCCVY